MAKPSIDKVAGKQTTAFETRIGEGGELTRDFVADAFGHCKFIAFNPEAEPLLRKAGIEEADRDEAIVPLTGPMHADAFVQSCGRLRFWDRELHVDLDAAAFLAATKG